jgi:hypothetical protein
MLQYVSYYQDVCITLLLQYSHHQHHHHVSSFAFVVVCYVVVSDACHCLYAVDLWLSVL